jgi:hypothetical protein
LSIDVKAARDIAEIAQQYIFQQLHMSEQSATDQGQNWRNSVLTLQALQAALNVIVILNWDGITSTRRRVRGTLMSKIIKVS